MAIGPSAVTRHHRSSRGGELSRAGASRTSFTNGEPSPGGRPLTRLQSSLLGAPSQSTSSGKTSHAGTRSASTTSRNDARAAKKEAVRCHLLELNGDGEGAQFASGGESSRAGGSSRVSINSEPSRGSIQLNRLQPARVDEFDGPPPIHRDGTRAARKDLALRRRMGLITDDEFTQVVNGGELSRAGRRCRTTNGRPRTARDLTEAIERVQRRFRDRYWMAFGRSLMASLLARVDEAAELLAAPSTGWESLRRRGRL